MTDIVKKAAELMACLPEKDQAAAYEYIKKLVLAWDPDFSKLTPAEARSLHAAETGEYTDVEAVDWDTILRNEATDPSV